MNEGLNQRRLSRVCARIAMIASLGLASCTGPELAMQSVDILADIDANDNSATAVDLVLLYHMDLVKTFGSLSAAQYFENAPQLLLDNPGLLDVWHWELVPGQAVQSFQPDQKKGRAFTGFVFANYIAPGPHRLQVPGDGILHVILEKGDLKNGPTSRAPDHQGGSTSSAPAVPPVEASDLTKFTNTVVKPTVTGRVPHKGCGLIQQPSIPTPPSPSCPCPMTKHPVVIKPLPPIKISP